MEFFVVFVGGLCVALLAISIIDIIIDQLKRK